MKNITLGKMQTWVTIDANAKVYITWELLRYIIVCIIR